MNGQAYLENGYRCAPQVLGSADIALLHREWERLWRDIDDTHPSVQRRGHAAGGSTADRLDPAYILSPVLDALATDARLTGLAAQVLGAPVVRFKDKLISKGPGTHGYGLHQDWPYWARYGVPAHLMTSLMIALDPCDMVSGALEVWPTAANVLPAPADDDARDVDPASVDLSLGTLVPLDPGDVLVLHPLAPHRSAPNRSGGLRRVYFLTYVTADYAPVAERYEAERLSAAPFAAHQTGRG